MALSMGFKHASKIYGYVVENRKWGLTPFALYSKLRNLASAKNALCPICDLSLKTKLYLLQNCGLHKGFGFASKVSTQRPFKCLQSWLSLGKSLEVTKEFTYGQDLNPQQRLLLLLQSCSRRCGRFEMRSCMMGFGLMQGKLIDYVGRQMWMCMRKNQK